MNFKWEIFLYYCPSIKRTQATSHGSQSDGIGVLLDFKNRVPSTHIDDDGEPYFIIF